LKIDYPKLNELIKRKNEVLQKRATPSMYLKCDLKNLDLSTLGKYDVILIDAPLPEYQRRVEGQVPEMSNLEPWSFEEIANLRIDALADQCCFLFLWVGSSEGLDKGRALLKKWNFRRCEDIVWIKTNKHNFNRRVVNDKDTLIVHTKEHCLVGIKGAVKRGVDGHFIHANIDTDVIVSEEPPFGSTEKPQELYRIIERFCLGRKRIELFGEDTNIRPGWVTLGKSLSGSNLDIDVYNSFFDGELCYPEVQGFQGGRYVGCTQEIESLRPRSPNRSQNSIINPLSNNMGMINNNFNSNVGSGNNSNGYNNQNQGSSGNFHSINTGGYNCHGHSHNYGNNLNTYSGLINNFGNANNQNGNFGYNYNYHTKNLFGNQNIHLNANMNNNSVMNNNQNTNIGTNQFYSSLNIISNNNTSASNFFNNRNYMNISNINNGNSNLNRNNHFYNNNNIQQSQVINQNSINNIYQKHNFILNQDQNFMKNGNFNSNMNTGIKSNNLHFDKQQNNIINFNVNNKSNFEDSNLNNLNNNIFYNQNS